MSTQIVIPNVGESVTSGVIAAWTVADGAYVERDETVLELETDKVTMEVPAPASGIVKHIAAEGDEVDVGAAVGEIDESAPKPAGDATPAPQAPAPVESTPAATPAPAPTPAPAAAPVAAGASNADVKATPLARKLADDKGFDLGSITGTGASGRIREQDVLAYIQTHQDGANAAPAILGGIAREVSVERMSPMRQAIASRLVEAQQTAAMLTTFNEVDMGAVMDMRKLHKEAFAEKHGINLGFMSFFVKATTQALQKFPLINSYIIKGDNGKPAIEKHSYNDIAIAVSGKKGLVVPVIRSAETLSFAGIESTIKDMALRARDGKITLEEMQGGTFTITNGGIFGSLMSTPILNPPQAAILGMHGIKKRPMEDPNNPGTIALRPMMFLALSYDHRIVDGAEAVQFLVSIKDAIEDPARLMLDL
ncbi:dihydrolipoyllysine-residue succinyltransferase [bacterium]|nr:MAG: dihydrolipoyllysine-residue succinyltransferase [bacterium]